MPRDRWLEEDILQLLEREREKERWMTHREIEESLRLEYPEKTFYHGSVGKALTHLAVTGLILSKADKNRHLIYHIPQEFKAESLKKTLIRMIDKTDGEAMIDLVGNGNASNIAFISPLYYDSELGVKLHRDSIILDPRTGMGVSDYLKQWKVSSSDLAEIKRRHFSRHWDSSNIDASIAQIMFLDFDTLPIEARNGILDLISWAYYTGLKSRTSLESSMIAGTRREYLKTWRQSAHAKIHQGSRSEDILGAKAMLKLLDFFDETVSFNDLGSFTEFFYNRRDELARANREIPDNAPYDGYVVAGLINDINGTIREGFAYAGLDFEASLNSSEISEADGVWEAFFNHILGIPNPVQLSGIGGGIDKGVKQLRKYSKYLPYLGEIAKKRKILSISSWNYPSLQQDVAKLDVITRTNTWCENLVKPGISNQYRLDHRDWIFWGISIRRVRKAIEDVRNGMSPDDHTIDKDLPSFRDIYEYHPRGRTESYWKKEILRPLLERKKNRANMKESDEAVSIGEAIYGMKIISTIPELRGTLHRELKQLR